MKQALLLVFVLALQSSASFFPITVLVSNGAVWRYRADGADQGAALRSNTFNDSGWLSGPAQLGWGDGDEATALLPAGDTGDAPTTTYFRSRFLLTNRFAVYTLTWRVVSDDGFVAYLNGREVFRRNMPGGPITFATPAAQAVEGAGETEFFQFGSFTDALVNGTNVVAVELHQSEGGHADASFDLTLIANVGYHWPQGAMLTPENGQTFASGMVTLTAEASDSDGHIGEVRYYINNGWVGTATQPPFTVQAAVGNGRHKVHAAIYDFQGYNTTTAPHYFQVGAETPVVKLRGPYLQMATPTSMTLRWRTDWPTNSVVRYGVVPGSMTFTQVLVHRTNEHVVTLGNLQPDTRYFYEVASSSQTLGSGSEYVFRTSPTNTRPATIWVIGDAGTRDANQRAVRDAYLDALGPEETDLWLMLGDNAYESGTDQQYQEAVFDMYDPILRRVPVWPTIGNHDSSAVQYDGRFTYLDIFTLPTAGEAGGVPSGTEKYYSFDFANIHFVCLDSESSSRAPNSPMLQWLREDLAATDKDWIIAYWHHPPYTFGTHDSDWELELIEMRENALPILESFGVDLVLCGHSHVYERSFLARGHYGQSFTLDPGMILDAGMGRVPTPYRKPAGGLGADGGTVYAVCGCSGQGGFFAFTRHPVMATNLSGLGSMILRVNGQVLDAEFIRPEGTIADSFRIDKSQPSTVRPRLDVTRRPGGASVAWPTSLPEYWLEQSRAVTNAPWQLVTNPPARLGRSNVVEVLTTRSNEFFRLRRNE